MYTDSSAFYDLIYSFKDYKKEAAEIIDIVKAKRPGCKTMLDVGCGTSEHHKYLKDVYQIDGIDLNEKFIQIAQAKNEHGTYTLADMRNFRLNKKYDVIICLFSSIGYLKRLEEITLTLKNFGAHLNPRGLLMIEPWFTPGHYYTGKLGMLAFDKEDVKICRMTRSDRQNELSILNIHYLVATPENGIAHFEERHELRLTTVDEMLKAFEQAGFNVTFDEEGLTGRGMYYGVPLPG